MHSLGPSESSSDAGDLHLPGSEEVGLHAYDSRRGQAKLRRQFLGGDTLHEETSSRWASLCSEKSVEVLHLWFLVLLHLYGTASDVVMIRSLTTACMLLCSIRHSARHAQQMYLVPISLPWLGIQQCRDWAWVFTVCMLRLQGQRQLPQR